MPKTNDLFVILLLRVTNSLTSPHKVVPVGNLIILSMQYHFSYVLRFPNIVLFSNFSLPYELSLNPLIKLLCLMTPCNIQPLFNNEYEKKSLGNFLSFVNFQFSLDEF